MTAINSKPCRAMRLAWDIYRSEARDRRPFRECLKAAWKLLRKFERPLRRKPPRPRPGLSPLDPRFSGAARDRFKAAYLTARLGR
jgi:hypothetical protein